jgi:hypothetical protein
MNKAIFFNYNKIVLIVFSIGVLLLTAGSICAEQLVLDKTKIIKDTIWQGELLLQGDVEIAKEVTLLIMPGTVIKIEKKEGFGSFKLNKDKNNHFPGIEIVVRGKIIAQGTKEHPIVFTSAAEKPNPGDWGGVNILASKNNIIEYCEFSYAHTAVHGHSAQVVVARSYFHHNGVATGQKNVKEAGFDSVMPMLYNRMTENGGGILYGGGSMPVIVHNEISNNKFFGIYAKKGGMATIRYNNILNNGKGIIVFKIKNGMLLRDNNISGNEDYNVSLLEGQEWDLNAQNNWWGETEDAKIRAKNRDKENDDSLAQIDVSHATGVPVEGAGLN